MAIELTHKQAVNRMKDITDEIERLGGKASLTSEDETSWFSLREEFEELDGHRKNLERASDLAKIRSVFENDKGRIENGVPGGNRSDGYDLDPILHPDSVQDVRFRNPWDLSEVRTFDRSRGEVNQEFTARALSAIEKMPGANDKIRSAATSIIEQFDQDTSIARLCLATSSPEYIRAWSKVASGRGHMISPDEQRALERAMSLTDSAGGYLVPFQLDPTVIIAANGSRNQIRQVARTVVATGDIWNGVSSGAVSWSWDGEAVEVSDDATSFTQPTISIYKAAGFVPISIEALQDEANVTTEVARLLSFGRDVLEAGTFATGSGSAQPFGIVTALTGTSAEITATAGNAMTAAHVYSVDNGLPARYRANASWLANRGIYNLIRQLDTAGGGQLWERIGADVPAKLLGRSVYEAEDMDGTVGTQPAATANRVLVYGDFDNYVIADRIGMTVEFVPHLMGANRKPSGQRGWYAYYRVGADSVNDGAFRMLNIPSV